MRFSKNFKKRFLVLWDIHSSKFLYIKVDDDWMEITISKGDTKFWRKVIPILFDPQSSKFNRIYTFTLLIYTKFGENLTEIMTFMTFIKF